MALMDQQIMATNDVGVAESLKECKMSRLTDEATLEQIDSWFGLPKAPIKVKSVVATTNPTFAKGGARVGWRPTVRPGEDEEEDVALLNRGRGRGLRVLNFKKKVGAHDYAKAYKEAEDRALIQSTSKEVPIELSGLLPSLSMASHGLEDLEPDSFAPLVTAEAEERTDETVQIFQNYVFRTEQKRDLVISKYREKIVSTIDSNQVTVIQGCTGSGKTTQVPQYILEHAYQQKRHCNIIVTQPRRIAAMSIAKRVCAEQKWQLGGLVGYQIGLEKNFGPDTRLLYVTTGVLLEKLVHKKSMTEYTHVVLDEIHERDSDTDFCLLVARKLLRTNSRNVKVILMSATIDSDMFAKYFSCPIGGHLEPAPIVGLEGKSFAVQEWYMEHVRVLGEVPYPVYGDPGITDEAYQITYKLVLKFDEMEQREQHVAGGKFAPERGSLLIFLPGINEINKMEEVLSQDLSLCLNVLPLHSSITAEEQAKVFDVPKTGQRKVILSTNIAESSITVPDIKYVIDFCLSKAVVLDDQTNYSCLKLVWASKANCTQRKGRAGRVSNGRCYRMVPERFYEDHLPDYATPELQRCPLEQIVLKVKLLDLGEPKAILALALQPPNLNDIERTVLMLKEIGALKLFTSTASQNNPHDGDLTFLGRVLGHLPVDVRLGKLLLMGHVFGCLNECLIIAAALSQRSFFSRPHKAQWEAYKSLMSFADMMFCDFHAIVNAYNMWEHEKLVGGFQRRGRTEYDWCRSYMIQAKRIQETFDLKQELEMRLRDFNIRPLQRDSQRRLMKNEESLVLKLVLCAAFYPYYFVKGDVDETDAVRSLCGMDPCNTVMLSGLPPKEGILYKSAIENLFKNCESPLKVHFESTKAYVEFEEKRSESNTAVSKIHEAVYLAVKMRAVRVAGLQLEMLDRKLVERKLAELEKIQDERAETHLLRTNRLRAVSTHVKADGDGPQHASRQVALPGTQTTIVAIQITSVVHCGHFWAYYMEEENVKALQYIQTTINMYEGSNLEPLITGTAQKGLLCLAPYRDPTVQNVRESHQYYRARIEAVIDSKTVKIFFVDFGNTEAVLIHHLRQMPLAVRQYPFQAMEYKLSEVKPAAKTNPDGRWNDVAKEEFVKMVAQIQEARQYFKIYSILHGVVRGELIIQYPSGVKFSINDTLIKNNLAEKAEENLLSQLNHKQREEAYETDKSYSTDETAWQDVNIDVDYNQTAKQRRRTIGLKGPHSPLEMKLYGMTRVCRTRQVRIERDSINSVLLDDEPQDKHKRLIVAANISLSPSGKNILARHTSLMPNFHGLPAIVALLFTPSAELRTDRDKTRYIGAVCGLGPDPQTGHPMFPDHDLEVMFDTEFTIEDLLRINAVRGAINLVMESHNNIATWSSGRLTRHQEKARDKLLQLFQHKQRESVEPTMFLKPYRWNQVDPDDVIPHGLDSTDLHEESVLLQYHNGIYVEGPESIEEEDRTAMVKDNLMMLQDIMSRKHELIDNPVKCELCNVTMESLLEVNKHLTNRKHQHQAIDYMD